MTAINIPLPEKLHKTLRVRAARKDTSIKEQVIEALRDYVSEVKR